MFTPALFMVGAARAMFLPLSLAVGFSMVASYLLSSTLVPVLSIWLLRGHPATAPARPVSAGAFDRFRQTYGRLLGRVVRWRWVVTALYFGGTALLLLWLTHRLPTEIFPSIEAGQLQVRLRAPAGTPVDVTEATALRALELIQGEAGSTNVALTLGFVGVHGANYPINLIYLWNGGPEEAVLQVQLHPKAPIRVPELKERLRGVFARQLPDVQCSFEPSDIVSRVMSLGAATPIEVAVSGPSLAANRAFAERVKERLGRIPHLRDLQFGQSLDYPTVEVNVDRQKAGLLGVRMADVARSLATATWSSRFVVPNYWADPNSGVAYQLQVQVPQARMDSLEQAKNLPIQQRDGQSLLLRNIATVTPGTAVGQYERYNMQRLVTVTANLAGARLGSMATEVAAALKELVPPPAGVNVALRGQVVPFQQMMTGLRTGLVLAIVVIFLLLTAHFQSFKLSVLVVTTVPAVLVGSLLTLHLAGTSLNLQSFMGAIMALGLAVANAILLVTFAERARLAGAGSREAAMEGARTRLRPILMTSTAMIAGMIPMALSLGEGGAQTAPLGQAVVGGLAGATLATLWVLPGIFSLIQDRAHRRSPSLHPDDATSANVLANT